MSFHENTSTTVTSAFNLNFPPLPLFWSTADSRYSALACMSMMSDKVGMLDPQLLGPIFSL